MPAAKQFDVLGMGGVAVDDVIYVSSYPPPDSKTAVVGRHRRCGGLAAIALISAARLGGQCAYAGVLGADELSLFGLESLSQENINISFVKQTARARPIHSTIVVDRQRGTRNIFFDVRRVIGARNDVPRDLIGSARVLLIDHLGVNGMIRAANIARRAGVPVVADFETSDHPRFPELLRLTDHLIVSLSFARMLTGQQSAERVVRTLCNRGHEVVVVTCGNEGCWYMAKGSKAPRHQPAFKVKTVDTTGCGDVFHGAYAFALARELSAKERIQLASAAAGLMAKSGGGIEGIPSLRQVSKLLK